MVAKLTFTLFDWRLRQVLLLVAWFLGRLALGLSGWSQLGQLVHKDGCLIVCLPAAYDTINVT